MAVIQIDTIEKLIALSNGDYGRGTSSEYLEVELTADLDFADYTAGYSWPGCTGDWYIYFNGNNHIIDNIYYTGSSNWYFFNQIKGVSIVQNVKLKNIYIITTNVVSTIGTATGLCTLNNIHVAGIYQSTGNNVSGIVNNANYTSGARIYSCGFSGKLLAQGSKDVCGIIFGGDSDTVISNCYVIADMRGATISGLTRIDMNVFNSFVRGTITASSAIYLFTQSSAKTTNCYAALTESNMDITGGGVNCYYDSTLATAGNYTVTGATGATTEELQSKTWLTNHNFAV